MTTFTLRTNTKIPAWKKPVMSLLVGLVLIDIGLRCASMFSESESRQSANDTNLETLAPSVEQGESVVEKAQLPVTAESPSGVESGLDQSQVELETTEQANA